MLVNTQADYVNVRIDKQNHPNHPDHLTELNRPQIDPSQPQSFSSVLPRQYHAVLRIFMGRGDPKLYFRVYIMVLGVGCAVVLMGALSYVSQ